MTKDQAQFLRHQINEGSIERKGRTISIISGKGGVGKSNIAVNFTLEMLANKQRVLLIDLDVGMGNIDILLGVHAEYTIVDMIKKRLNIEDIIEKGPEQLSYIAGGSGINELFSMSEKEADYFLKQYEKIQHTYDYIIFDIGAGATSHTMFFILASDECFVVTTPEPTSLTDAYGMIKHVSNHNQNIPIYIVFNRTRSHRRGRQAMEQFQQVIDRFLNIEAHALGILPYDQEVLKAVYEQKPLILLNNRSPLSRGIQQMTKHYLQKPYVDNVTQTSTFVDRLKRFFSGSGN